jgi:hypothetical protein
MRDQGGDCWFDLHHTWPNGQVWALVSRPDRGCPARVWLVGPRRTVPIRGGGGQGLKGRGSPPSRHLTPNPSRSEGALPAAGSITSVSIDVATAPPPVAALAQNFTSDPVTAGSSRSSPMVRHSCCFSSLSLSPSLVL